MEQNTNKMYQFTNDEIAELPTLLSAPRFARYLAETGNDTEQALKLYQWNLELSGEFLKVLHICEIGIRNGISDAITEVHGDRWPWVQGFRVSLQNPRRGYNPRRNLEDVARLQPSTGKVIAELKFAFWERMLNSSHQQRLWDHKLEHGFPNADRTKGSAAAREKLRNSTYAVRSLRNRIAHHEPIFYRPSLTDDFDHIISLIDARCAHSAAWIGRWERVTFLLNNKP